MSDSQILHHRFMRTVKKYPGKTAFVDRTLGKSITYRQAFVGASVLARKFSQYEGKMLGVMLPTGIGGALAVIGTLMSGKTPVMINYSTGAAENVLYAGKKCGFRTVITSRALLTKIECEPSEEMVFLEDIMKETGALTKLGFLLKSLLPAGLLCRMTASCSADDNAVVLLTSGSEKEPKAVPLTHRNIASNIASFSEVIDLSESDTVLAILPYFHVFGITINLWMPLWHGMKAVACANPLDLGAVCEAAREEKPTLVFTTPVFFQGYLRKSQPGDFGSVRLAAAGADKCPQSLRDGYLKKHGITLMEGYGTTETSPVISLNLPGANRPGSVGQALPGVEVRIEELETGRQCEAGEEGRILVRGDLVMTGYLNDPRETAACLKDGWYDTGDMGRIDEDGYIWHHGRLKRFAKIGGEMVSLVRVEDVLAGLLPEGAECCVVEIPDEAKGGRIIAVVTQEVDRNEILKAMSGQLPNIALPKQFEVIEELPKTGSGKVDFRKVGALYS